MDWANERYVRAYVRDTMTYLTLPWQGKITLWPLLRKLDRAGVLDFGEEGYLTAVSVMTGIPLEHVEVGVAALLEKGILVLRQHYLVFPNFIEAQEANVSDRMRAKEYRARRRDKFRLDEIMHGEEPSEQDFSDETDPSGDDEARHKSSHGVTPRDGKATAPAQESRHKSSHGVTPRDDAKMASSGGNKPGASRHVTPPSRHVTPPSQNGRNRHSEPNQPSQISDLNLQASSSGLIGSQRAEGSTDPGAEEDEPTRIICPSDLWERIPEATKAMLETALIPRSAQETATIGFAAKYVGNKTELRFPEQWVRSAVTTIQGDWNAGRHRPPSPAGSSAAVVMLDGKPKKTLREQMNAGPISRRLSANHERELAELLAEEEKAKAE